MFLYSGWQGIHSNEKEPWRSAYSCLSKSPLFSKFEALSIEKLARKYLCLRSGVVFCGSHHAVWVDSALEILISSTLRFFGLVLQGESCVQVEVSFDFHAGLARLRSVCCQRQRIVMEFMNQNQNGVKWEGTEKKEFRSTLNREWVEPSATCSKCCFCTCMKLVQGFLIRDGYPTDQRSIVTAPLNLMKFPLLQ